MAERPGETFDVIRPSWVDWVVFATVGVLWIASFWLSFRPIPGVLTGEVLAMGDAVEPREGLLASGTGQDGRRGALPFGVVRWLRYELAPSLEARYLIAEPSTLDTLDITLFTSDGTFVTAATIGDRHPRPEGSAIALTQNVLVPPLPDGGTMIVRLQTKGMNAVTLSAVPASAFARREATGWLSLAVFFGGRLFLLILSTVMARTYRQAVWRWFAAQSFMSVAFSLGASGPLGVILPSAFAPWVDELSTFAVIGYVATSFILHAQMLKLFDAPDRLVRFSLAVSIVPFTALALDIMGASTVALTINSFAILGFGVLLLASSGTLRSGAGAPTPLVRLAYGATGSAVLTQALPIFGWTPMSKFSIQGGALAPLVAGLLALWLLLHRAEAQRRAFVATQQQLALAEQRAVLDRESRLAADRFVGVLAHTIRTPLSLIRLVLEDDAAGERARELARSAVRDVDGVLERCVQLARLELGETPIRRAPTAVGEVAASAIDWTRLGERARCNGPEGRVNVDAHALSSILFELLDNAVRYAPEASRVDVAWSFDPGAVTLSVTSSVGRLGTLDPEQVFDRYARGEKAHAVTGAGLGLHLVRVLAERHGGGARYTCDGGTVRVEVSLAC